MLQIYESTEPSLDENSCTFEDFIFKEESSFEIRTLLDEEMDDLLLEHPLFPSTYTRLKNYDINLEIATIIYAQYEAWEKSLC